MDRKLPDHIPINSEPDHRPPVVPVEPTDQEGRIRIALGLVRGPLPHVTVVELERYYDYLLRHLELPFAVRYAGDLKPLGQPAIPMAVLALIHPRQTPAPEQTGLTCQASYGHQQLELPLVDLEVADDGPNAQKIEDYWYWFWNWRFDPRI